MFYILGLSLLIISSLVLAGAPVAAICFLNKKNTYRIDLITFIAISIVIGFGISGLAVACAFGFIGLNKYVYIFLTFTIILWLILILKFRNLITWPDRNKYSLYFLSPLLFISVFFSSNQWDKQLKPILRSGTGPDVSQHLMAAQAVSENGQTWFSTVQHLLQVLGLKNLNDVPVKFFEVPSYHALAGYDYLVFGGRWGLNVPYSQILRYFGAQATIAEVGVILATTLLCISIILYSSSKLVTNSNFMALVISMTIICNASFLYQYFNGGLSQAFSLIGVAGLLLVLTLVFDSNFISRNLFQKIGIFIVGISAWIGAAITYIDQIFIILMLMVFLYFALVLIDRKTSTKIFQYIILPGAVSVTLMPVFIYTIIASIGYRAKAALGTGTESHVWQAPTQLLGWLNSYYATNTNQNVIYNVSIFLSLLLFVFIILNFIKNSNFLSIFTPLTFISTIIIITGYFISLKSNSSSSYIYGKITLYIGPFLIFSTLTTLYMMIKSGRYKNFILVLMIFPIISIIGALSFNNSFLKTNESVVIPNSYAKLINDRSLQTYLNSNNYIIPSNPAYYYLGMLGVDFWISKAPNDMNLNSRLDNNLLLLCFTGDKYCAPKTKEITNPDLIKYGIQEYASDLSTREYVNLSITERYNYSFDALGIARITIPPKYIGGNPYLK